MTKTHANDPAIPITETITHLNGVQEIKATSEGMTKRETIAMHLLSGMLAGDWSGGANEMAEDAVRYADALINALNRTAQ